MGGVQAEGPAPQSVSVVSSCPGEVRWEWLLGEEAACDRGL